MIFWGKNHQKFLSYCLSGFLPSFWQILVIIFTARLSNFSLPINLVCSGNHHQKLKTFPQMDSLSDRPVVDDHINAFYLFFLSYFSPIFGRFSSLYLLADSQILTNQYILVIF
ncbi:hypothetical protein [Okeania sp. KiyG1]|uniref:hypothetical protein n=1 Tax=Okeania sp. KiyG1 TaxID=2720165 RepID=UPI0019231809|nr:hypothetical protein [Okeania sp. KiyG1]